MQHLCSGFAPFSDSESELQKWEVLILMQTALCNKLYYSSQTEIQWQVLHILFGSCRY